jgi:hypothetical protein
MGLGEESCLCGVTASKCRGKCAWENWWNNICRLHKKDVDDRASNHI